MSVGYQVIFVFALLWETVYTLSYGCVLLRTGKKLGGAAVALLSALPVAVFVFLTFFHGE